MVGGIESANMRNPCDKFVQYLDCDGGNTNYKCDILELCRTTYTHILTNEYK